MPESHLAKKIGILEFHRRSLPSLLRGNQEFELAVLSGPKGAPAEFRLGGHPAVRHDLSLKLMGTPCLETMIEMVAEDVGFFMELAAPKDKFDGLQDTLEKMLRTFRAFPDRTRLERAAQPTSPTDILDLYREATVLIKTELGTGSGFFVRDDGYVLTNHHVICDWRDHRACTAPSRMKLAKNLSIVWDKKIGPKRAGEEYRSLDAELVDTVYAVSPQTDLALLKVPAGRRPYRVIPISPVGSGGVREGDRIAALGFPLPTKFDIGNLFATDGIISRVNYLQSRFETSAEARRLDDILTTAEVQPGNSGGPAIDLFTRGCIGLNTYIALTLGGEQLDYFGVCPIDHALYHFPQLRWYPRQGGMTPQQHLELGALLLTQENYRAAGRELFLALNDAADLDPDLRARLYHQLFLYYRNGLDQPGRAGQMLAKCLEEDEFHGSALTEMAYLHCAAKELGKAVACVDKLVGKNPELWWPYLHRAGVYRQARRYEDAQKDLTRAFERGGGYDPELHRLQGYLHFDVNQLEEGLAAFKKAVEIDPADVEAKTWIAHYYARKGNQDGAKLEYARIVKDHPDEPLGHLRYASFLKGRKGDEAEALKHCREALGLILDRGEKPAFELLRDTGELCRKLPGNLWASFETAMLIHRYHPTPRHWAHNFLADFWNGQCLITQDGDVKDGDRVVGSVRARELVEKLQEEKGWVEIRLRAGNQVLRGWAPKAATKSMGALARAHFAASDCLYKANYGAESKLAAALAPEALDFTQYLLLVKMRYSPQLLEETLLETSVGFQLTSPRLGALAELRVQPWQIGLLVIASHADHVRDREALGRMLRVLPRDQSVVRKEDGFHGRYGFENMGELPLTSVILRETYGGENERVLHRLDRKLGGPGTIFWPGKTLDYNIAYAPWVELKRAGIGQDDIKWVQLDVVSARSAEALSQLRFENVKVTAKGYELSISNPSFFVLRSAQVRVDYTDRDGNSVGHRDTGEWVSSETVTLDLMLPSGKISGGILMKDWANASYIIGRGAPREAPAFLRPAFVSADFALR